MLLKLKEVYRFWLTLHQDFPKVERRGIGEKIEKTFLDTMELAYSASYLPPEFKIPALGKVISRLDIVKFFIQLAWEAHLIGDTKYAELIASLEEIGRQLGGWKRGLQQKTPTK